MPISAEQWRAVVGSNNVRRPCQVSLKEQLLFKDYTKHTNTLDDPGGTSSTADGVTEDGAFYMCSLWLLISVSGACIVSVVIVRPYTHSRWRDEPFRGLINIELIFAQ